MHRNAGHHGGEPGTSQGRCSPSRYAEAFSIGQRQSTASAVGSKQLGSTTVAPPSSSKSRIVHRKRTRIRKRIPLAQGSPEM